MTIPKIASKLGWTEIPEITTGLYLQPEEVAKIEKELTGSNASNNSTVEVAAKDKRIKELEAQVQSMSNGNNVTKGVSNLVTLNDASHPANQLADLATGKVSGAKKETYDLSSPDHPANKMADLATGGGKLAGENKS